MRKRRDRAIIETAMEIFRYHIYSSNSLKNANAPPGLNAYPKMRTCVNKYVNFSLPRSNVCVHCVEKRTRMFTI